MASEIKAFLFGITVGLTIGPIALLIVSRGITYGFSSAARCGVGAALADFCYAAGAVTSSSVLVQWLAAHNATIKLASAFVLLLFGISMLVGAIRKYRTAPEAAELSHGNRELIGTFLLTISNPMTLIGFLGFVGQVARQMSFASGLRLAVAVFLGSLCMQLLLAAGSALLHRTLHSRRALLAINVLSGLGVIAFGVMGLLAVV